MWPTDFQKRCRSNEYNVEIIVFSINDVGTIGRPREKEKFLPNISCKIKLDDRSKGKH